MKFVRFIGPAGGKPAQGVIFDGEVYDIAAIGRMYQGTAMTMIESDLREQNFAGAERRLRSFASELTPEDRCPLPEAHLLAPVLPPSFRDFYAFEEHVKNARRRRGLDMIPEWYDAPAFYFSNTASIVGPDTPIKKPAETDELDFELEIAVVVGKDGADIPVDQADSYIAGFTILNDWSARDIQRREMKVGLGPAKGKDFATSIGPYLVTPDELDEHVLPDHSRGKRYDLTMTASVNGREYARGNARDTHWTFAELIAHASRNTRLVAGDLIGSGTVGGGCIVEYPEGTYPWLQPGDEVTLSIDRLGELTNRVE